MGLEEFASTEDHLAAAADRLVDEFQGVFDRETIERALAGSADELSGRGVESFVAILAERFTLERLKARAQSEGLVEKSAVEVVFVSLTGAGRAQIAAAMLAHATGDRVSVHTAGSQAISELDPTVGQAMAEIGIDLTDEFTRPLTSEILGNADIVVTMGRNVGALEIPDSVRHIDWRVGDPAGAELDEVRRVREDIGRRVSALAESLPA